MRFPDGAIRPAYNAQIAAAPKEGVIVSIEVTDRRNDAGLAEPMVDDIVRRYGRTPDRLLVDTSYATSEDIVGLAAHAAGPVSVYTPPPRKGEHQAGHACAADPKAGEKTRLASRSGGNAWRAKRARLSTPCASASSGSTPTARTMAWFSCRARADQGQGSRALAFAREQSPRRSPSEDRNPMRRSTRPHPSPSPPEPPSPQASDRDLRVEETPSGPHPNTKMRFLHTLGTRE